MKDLVIAALLCIIAYLSVQVITLRHEKQQGWDKSSRTYMLIQEAYNEGLAEGQKGEQP